jgi:hypothetical protein
VDQRNTIPKVRGSLGEPVADIVAELEILVACG